jgi:hypothetical protein
MYKTPRIAYTIIFFDHCATFLLHQTPASQSDVIAACQSDDITAHRKIF